MGFGPIPSVAPYTVEVFPTPCLSRTWFFYALSAGRESKEIGGLDVTSFEREVVQRVQHTHTSGLHADPILPVIP